MLSPTVVHFIYARPVFRGLGLPFSQGPFMQNIYSCQPQSPNPFQQGTVCSFSFFYRVFYHHIGGQGRRLAIIFQNHSTY